MMIVDRENFLICLSELYFADTSRAQRARVNLRGTKGLAIKGETRGTDFFVTDLCFEREDSEQKLKGPDVWVPNQVTPPVDFETEVLDELRTGQQHFAVFTILEAEQLISRLQKAVEDQKAPASRLGHAPVSLLKKAQGIYFVRPLRCRPSHHLLPLFGHGWARPSLSAPDLHPGHREALPVPGLGDLKFDPSRRCRGYLFLFLSSC